MKTLFNLLILIVTIPLYMALIPLAFVYGFIAYSIKQGILDGLSFSKYISLAIIKHVKTNTAKTH